jgi:hypothetical protein
VKPTAFEPQCVPRASRWRALDPDHRTDEIDGGDRAGVLGAIALAQLGE